MQSQGPLDFLPLWAFFLAVLLFVFGAVEGGYRLGRYRRNRAENEKDAPVGSMAGATLGLLAFMLAFTFGLAASRFDVRRQVLLDEANHTGEARARAQGVAIQPEPIPARGRRNCPARVQPHGTTRLGVEADEAK